MSCASPQLPRTSVLLYHHIKAKGATEDATGRHEAYSWPDLAGSASGGTRTWRSRAAHRSSESTCSSWESLSLPLIP